MDEEKKEIQDASIEEFVEETEDEKRDKKNNYVKIDHGFLRFVQIKNSKICVHPRNLW